MKEKGSTSIHQPTVSWRMKEKKVTSSINKKKTMKGSKSKHVRIGTIEEVSSEDRSDDELDVDVDVEEERAKELRRRGVDTCYSETGPTVSLVALTGRVAGEAVDMSRRIIQVLSKHILHSFKK